MVRQSLLLFKLQYRKLRILQIFFQKGFGHLVQKISYNMSNYKDKTQKKSRTKEK